MSIQQSIDTDLKTAMKARETAKVTLLRGLKASFKNVLIDNGGADGELSDEDAMKIVRKQVKQREDSIASFEKGGRADLVEKEQAEAELLAKYLPRQLSTDEVQAMVAEAIAETGALARSEMGAVMKVLQQKAAGRVDGKTLSQEVVKRLA